ncbi:MAG TPA: tetratricopeptide repeat protein [Thauera sp.]|nr:tetratricopeptide repeat protein [Thauera sp.]
MDRLLRTAIVLAGLLSVVGGAAAGTEGDYQALRAWCVQRTANQNNAAWQAANNPERYFHFQHYCFGMQWENKLITAANQKDRVAVANTIINETSYVIRHVPRTHFLIPEVHVLRGRAYYASKRYVEAEVDLLGALQLDPRHARAAVQLATLYRNTDRPAKAVEVVQAALLGSPGDFRLRKLGKELGVALPPVPERAATQPAAPEPPVATSVPEASPDAHSAAATAAATDEGDAAEAVDGATSACRFCPPAEIQKRWREYFDEAQQP